MLKKNPAEARKLADAVVKNTYRTLMTRGMKGCYVYCTDAALADHLRACLASEASDISTEGSGARSVTGQQGSNVVALRRVPEASRLAGEPALPVLELRAAAGAFSDFQALENAAVDWVAPPAWVKPQPGMFVAQVVGESMNRRIPSGSWCLFRANPAGSREGKVVLVQHRSIADPETGGRFTVKVYSSVKAADREGSWRHRRIVLKPDTDQPGYEPIVLELNEEQDEVQVVAEWLMVMPTEET
jgi:SOS-response transcriptional repressor LexA